MEARLDPLQLDATSGTGKMLTVPLPQTRPANPE